MPYCLLRSRFGPQSFALAGGAVLLRMDADLGLLVGLLGGQGLQAERAAAAEAADIDMLVALARPPPPVERKHPQRGWQLMKEARAAKKAKATNKEKDEAVAAKERAESSLAAMSAMCPAAAARLKLGFSPGVMDERRAEIVATLALGPSVRSTDDTLVRAQRRAVSLVAEAALRAQADFCQEVFGSLRLRVSPAASASVVSAPFCTCLTWQWDETSQKTRNLLGKLLPGEKRSDSLVANQVLMQSGQILLYESLAQGAYRIAAPDPVVCRGTFLQATSADKILEAILRNYPVPLEDAAALAEMLSGDGVLLLCFAHDRAASNFPVLRCFFSGLGLPEVPKMVFPHAEACVLHGLQLTRVRPVVGRGLVGATFSLTRFLRNWRSRESLRQELITSVTAGLLIDTTARDAAETEEQDAALDLLFGKQGAAEGCKVNPFREDVRRLLDLVSLHATELRGRCPPGRHGSEADFVQEVVVAVLNALLSKSWVVGSEGRWTHTLRILSRFVLGCLLGGILPASLDAARAFAGVALDLEHQLAALVAQQAGDPHSDASRKLRLIRICKTLCVEAARWQAAIMVTGLRLVDDFMYHCFGADSQGRPKLLDLLGWKTPRYAELQAALWGLLRDYGPGSPSWLLLRLTGCDFAAVPVRRFARAFLLQLLGAQYDHFGSKWKHAPYSLLPCLEAETPVAEKRSRGRAFFADPWHCKSMFLKRLQMMFPSLAALLREGVHVLRAWNEATLLGIDATERSHWALRLQLRSTSKARNATAALNRTFLHAAGAEHSKRHGRWPSSGAALADSVADKDGSEPRRRAGTGFFELLNHKMATHKRTVAAARPMTQDEMTDVRRRSVDEWAAASPDAKDCWATVAREAAVVKRLAPNALVAKPPAEDGNNLWGLPKLPDALLPPARIAEEYKRSPFEERERRSTHDPALFLTEAVAGRVVADEEADDLRLTAISSCWEAKKNVCRHSLGPSRARLVDGLCAHLSRFAAELGDSAEHCVGLLRLRGSGGATTAPDAASSPVDVVVLLALSRKRPKVQIFAYCFVEQAVAETCPLGPVPFHVQLRCGPSPHCGRIQGLDLCTSDDLALCMVTLRSDWQLVPLVWVESPVEPSLVRFLVVGQGPPVDIRRPRRARPAKSAAGLLGLLRLLEGPVLPGPAALAFGVPYEAESSEESDELLPDFPEDFREDAAAELAESLGFDVEEEAASVLAGDSFGEAGEPEPAADVASNPDAEAAAFEDVAADSGGAALDVPLDLGALAAAAVLDSRGWVTSPVPPWNDLPSIGAVTTWPKTVSLEKRSISCKCHLHTDCSTPARKLKDYPADWLLRWLFSGVSEPLCPGWRDAQLRDDHKKTFPIIMDEMRAARAAAPAAATSSAAG